MPCARTYKESKTRFVSFLCILKPTTQHCCRYSNNFNYHKMNFILIYVFASTVIYCNGDTSLSDGLKCDILSHSKKSEGNCQNNKLEFDTKIGAGDISNSDISNEDILKNESPRSSSRQGNSFKSDNSKSDISPESVLSAKGNVHSGKPIARERHAQQEDTLQNSRPEMDISSSISGWWFDQMSPQKPVKCGNRPPGTQIINIWIEVVQRESLDNHLINRSGPRLI